MTLDAVNVPPLYIASPLPLEVMLRMVTFLSVSVPSLCMAAPSPSFAFIRVMFSMTTVALLAILNILEISFASIVWPAPLMVRLWSIKIPSVITGSNSLMYLWSLSSVILPVALAILLDRAVNEDLLSTENSVEVKLPSKR